MNILTNTKATNINDRLSGKENIKIEINQESDQLE